MPNVQIFPIATQVWLEMNAKHIKWYTAPPKPPEGSAQSRPGAAMGQISTNFIGLAPVPKSYRLKISTPDGKEIVFQFENAGEQSEWFHAINQVRWTAVGDATDTPHGLVLPPVVGTGGQPGNAGHVTFYAGFDRPTIPRFLARLSRRTMSADHCRLPFRT